MGRTEDEADRTTEADGMGLGEFLSHRTNAGSGEFLAPWREQGSTKIVLHPNAGFHALWNHNWPRVITVQDRETRDDKLIVVSSRFVCHDPETLARKARYTDDDGRREHPPLVCPMDFMLDWVAGEIADGRLDWCAPVFEMKCDDEERCVVLHAGGMIGLYGKRDLTKDQRREMKAAGISMKTAWREKAAVRCQYLMQVVDVADPSAGVVKALEAGDLGDKMKNEIRSEIKKRGERGNPALNPYPILWEYNEAEEQFAKKYSVTALSDERPSAAVMKVLRGPKLDLSSDIAPGNCLQLRTEMEAHCVLSGMPFDKFFAEAERRGLMKPATTTSTAKARPKPTGHVDDEPESERRPAKTASSVKGALPSPKVGAAKTQRNASDDEPESVRKPAAAKAKPLAHDDDADDESAPCDFCAEPVALDDEACGSCRTTFRDNGKNILIGGLACRSCSATVTIDERGTRFECPHCGAAHALSPSLDEFYDRGGPETNKLSWTLESPPETKIEERPTRGRRGSAKAQKQTDAAIDAKLGGDTIPF